MRSPSSSWRFEPPRVRLQQLIWPLVALVPVFSAILQGLTGYTVNFIHDAVFLALVVLAWALNRWRAPLGTQLFLMVLPLFLIWLSQSPGVGALFIGDFTGYSGVLMFPMALSAVWFGLPGVLAFVLYTLVLGALVFPLPETEQFGVIWFTVMQVAAGSTLAWLLKFGDETFEVLRRGALTDPLTGLGNRRAFDDALDSTWQERPAHLCLALMDLDGLKQINDLHGHEAGDQVLRDFGRNLAGHLRSGQQGFRLGGDEYVVLCTHPGPHDLGAQARQAAREVRAADFADVDVSVGEARREEAGDPRCLLHLADLRMYVVKRAKSPARTVEDPDGETEGASVAPGL
ncbi:GGDEF domain-containing protein [Deinococcus hohokamensis]|uniref:GGDEF domain-containing protein n=1 Tax=Deinococcus hohokamensis TaxID=309883 RepID=A0ABV9I3S3_9DEIO